MASRPRIRPIPVVLLIGAVVATVAVLNRDGGEPSRQQLNEDAPDRVEAQVLEGRQQLHEELKQSHRQQPYGWESILAVDGAGGRIELIYSAATESPDHHGGDKGEWNREHLWPRSYGIGSSGPDFTDLHNHRPCDVAANSARGNRFFDEGEGTADSWEPPDDEKGDIARSMVYMAIRYEGDEENTEDLELVDSPASGSGNFGMLSTLIRWHDLDPPDDAERERNGRVEGLQGNRNPFVDHPELIGKYWGR